MNAVVSQNAAMDAGVKQLLEQFGDARTNVLLHGNPGTQARALEADRGYIEKLDTTLRDQVLAGRTPGNPPYTPNGAPYALSDWLVFAQNVSSDIATMQDEAATGGLSDFWSQVVAQSAQDVGDGVIAGAKDLREGTPYFLVVAALVAIAVIVVKLR